MKENYAKMIKEWSVGYFDASLENGESALSLSTRLQQFLDKLVQRPEKEILVCTHGRTLRCMMCLVNQKHLREMENYHHHNTGLYKTHWKDGAFEVELENNILHLNT